jgi:ABC-type antimicrobial peptide transport system permease subunit
VEKEPLNVEFRRVTSGYFEAINNPIVRGRLFDDGDLARETAVVIDERVATALFGDRDPIGAEIVGPDRAGGGSFGRRTVVGVIRHVRLYGPEVDSRLQVYLPAITGSGSTFMVRTSRAPATVTPAIQAAFAPGQRVGSSEPLEIRRIEDAFRNITAGRRFNAGLMSLFGLLGIIIGAAGVYCVMASVVAQQMRELGVRVALGATSASIVVGVLTQAGRYVAAGLLIGVPAAWLASRSIASLLFEARPTDVGAYLVAVGLIIVSGIIAAWVPARRAARVDPVVALRAE